MQGQIFFKNRCNKKVNSKNIYKNPKYAKKYKYIFKILVAKNVIMVYNDIDINLSLYVTHYVLYTC